MVDIELHADIDRIIGHGKGVALAEVDDRAAVADLGDVAEIVVISLGGACLYLYGLSRRGRGNLLAVDRYLDIAVGIFHNVYGKLRVGGGLDYSDNGDGCIRHGKAHLVERNGLGEVVVVDLDGLKDIVAVGHDLKSDAVAFLCILRDGAANLRGDGGVGDIGENPVALAVVIASIDLERRRDGHGEVGHGELAVLHRHSVAVVVIGDADIVEHEAGGGRGLDGDLRAGIRLAHGCIVNHSDDAAVV